MDRSIKVELQNERRKRMDKNHTCCFCQKSDENVKVLNTETPAHPQCIDLAALGKLAEEIGWKKP